MKEICLDTGVLGIFFSNNPTSQVKQLMKEIQNKRINAYLPKPVLIESFLHICKNDGKESAKITLLNFLNKYPVNLVEFDYNLIIQAGQIKCQHRKTLSYIDCMGIAIALNKRIEFHTTEINLKKIPSNILNKLKVVKYSF
ncbi:PIN domain-containing protein [Candidatus Harpocratesius sp.]